MGPSNSKDHEPQKASQNEGKEASSANPTPPSEAEPPLLVLQDAPDLMSAFIPKGFQFPSVWATMTYDNLKELCAQKGYKSVPLPESFEKIQKVLALTYPILQVDLVVLVGVPEEKEQPYKLVWLNKPKTFIDLVSPGVPFAQVTPPKVGKPAYTIYGEEFKPNQAKDEKNKKEKPASKNAAPSKNNSPTLTLSPELKYDEKNQVYCEKGGQVSLQGNELKYTPFYKLDSLNGKSYKNITFDCDVIIKCDIEGELYWVVNGNLLVEGYWRGCPIEVTGNIEVKSGLHTNHPYDEKKAITCHGDMKAHFIEMTCLKVAGTLTVEKSISASLLRVKGDIICSSPGIIVSSDITTLGNIQAQKISGESTKITSLRFLDPEKAMKSKITSVGVGTRVTLGRKSKVIKNDRPWPLPNEETEDAK
jgi:hypothetical protein